MQISAVRMNYPVYNNYNNNRANKSQAQSFKGSLSSLETNVVLESLSKKNTKVIENFTKSILDRVISELTSKYRNKNVNSVGMMVVGNDDLPKLLGKDVTKYDTKGKIGLCVAVGDTYGPVERMKNVYEAQTILTTMESLKL